MGLNFNRPKPQPQVPPPPPPARYMRVSVWQVPDRDQRPLSGGLLQLDDDAGTTVVAHIEDGRLRFTLPDHAVYGHGATLTVTWQDNAHTVVRRVILATDADVTVTAPPPPLRALYLADRYGFRDRDESRPFNWQGATAFQLLDLVSQQRFTELDAFFDALPDVNVARALLMLDGGLFRLTPDDGLRALPVALDYLRSRNVYLHLTLFAGTKAWGFSRSTIDAIAQEAGRLCAASPACISTEIGNELYPLHPSQAPPFDDVMFLRDVADTIRKGASTSGRYLPVSLGSTHGGADESDIFRDGDYLTVHGDRAGGDFGWRWVRHTKEQRDLSERVNRYVVNDEPRRDDLGLDKHFAMGALCRMMSLGDTFHFHSGLNCRTPTVDEARAFAGRRAGWNAIPLDWRGHYLNTGHVGSPVKGFTSAVRCYSSIRGDEGFTLAMGAGADGGRFSIEWSDEWPMQTELASHGGVRLYSVAR